MDEYYDHDGTSVNDFNGNVSLDDFFVGLTFYKIFFVGYNKIYEIFYTSQAKKYKMPKMATSSQ